MQRCHSVAHSFFIVQTRSLIYGPQRPFYCPFRSCSSLFIDALISATNSLVTHHSRYHEAWSILPHTISDIQISAQKITYKCTGYKVKLTVGSSVGSYVRTVQKSQPNWRSAHTKLNSRCMIRIIYAYTRWTMKKWASYRNQTKRIPLQNGEKRKCRVSQTHAHTHTYAYASCWPDSARFDQPRIHTHSHTCHKNRYVCTATMQKKMRKEKERNKNHTCYYISH